MTTANLNAAIETARRKVAGNAAWGGDEYTVSSVRAKLSLLDSEGARYTPMI